MVQNLSSDKTPELKHISKAADEIVTYIDQRRKGIVKSLKTRWTKFNHATMGGIEPNIIMTIAGISGSGKSSFVNGLESDIIDLNRDEDIIVLSFNFEMLSSKQIGRKLSKTLTKTTNELYSCSHDSEPVSDELFKVIEKEAERIKHYPIYYVDMPCTVDQIQSLIRKFQYSDKLKNKWLIVILDHTLLTRGKAGEQERETLANLQKVFMEAKKIGKTTIIQLSQMNRDIESSERITNATMHFPMRRDLFGSDSLFQASDYVMVLHRPELLGIKSYSPNNWPVKDKIYLHILKSREGEPKILSFVNNLKYNRIDEY